MQSDDIERDPEGASAAPAPSDLPSVGRVLETPGFRDLAARHGDRLVAALLRAAVGRLREAVTSGELTAERLARASAPEALAATVAREAERLLAPSPKVVINATGVVAHTNLGRSILSEPAARRVAEAATSYLDLEYDTETGRRGDRAAHLGPLLDVLFPGHASLVVNNNAAAILLALRALANRREVVVSRGELVEIGGAFRVPDILAASGARLHEVGTTNRTRLADYEGAIGPKTGVVLKVHTSNFKIVGFSEEAGVGELSSLCRRAGVPLVVDWGSGDLIDLAFAGIRDETPVARILADGADLVTFSGDKLLGGPQAGLAVGAPALVKKMRRDPMARVVRIDRLLTCALRETLVAYIRGRAVEEIPTLRMIAASEESIAERADAVRIEVERRLGEGGLVAVEPGVSRTGGGSSPVGEIPTRLVVVAPPHGHAARIERRLRGGDPPVIARIADERVLLDLRTVDPSSDAIVVERLVEALGPTRVTR